MGQDVLCFQEGRETLLIRALDSPISPPPKGGKQTTPKDFVIVETDGPALPQPITLKKGLTGAKPEKFCDWVLDLLNAQVGDEIVDLFPGTGVMGTVALRRMVFPMLLEAA